MTIGEIVTEPLKIHRLGTAREQIAQAKELLDDHRSEPGAHQPLSARVLRRTAAAYRHRARARAQAQAHRRRRAGLGARRVDPGAGAQPARQAAGRVRPHVPLHRARPVGRAAHLRRDRRHVPRQDRRDRGLERALQVARATPTRSRCCRRCPCRTPASSGRASASCWRATRRARSIRRPAAGSTRDVRSRSCPMCADKDPELREIAPGHFAACHFATPFPIDVRRARRRRRGPRCAERKRQARGSTSP